MSSLDQLKALSVVVVDTGNLNEVSQYRPRDATTNPSLIYRAVQSGHYEQQVEAALEAAGSADSPTFDRDLLDNLLVAFGVQILQTIPGRVSTEVDARLAFDAEASVAMARRLIALYEAAGYGRERVLIKLPANWEGVCAAKVLEAEGIHCNMTLIFSLAQAIACAQVGATLISPFVGRILDWALQHSDRERFPADEDPGVLSVREIYRHFKAVGYSTEIMGASFRNVGEIVALAGCDLLTLSPKFLKELEEMDCPIDRRLDPADCGRERAWEQFDGPSLRTAINEDPMASDKLSEGIRLFAADTRALLEKVAYTPSRGM